MNAELPKESEKIYQDILGYIEFIGEEEFDVAPKLTSWSSASFCKTEEGWEIYFYSNLEDYHKPVFTYGPNGCKKANGSFPDGFVQRDLGKILNHLRSTYGALPK